MLLRAALGRRARGDGYLIGLANVLLEGRSNLVVVDTQHMEDGAVATVKLPFRLNLGIHGWWVPGELINTRGTT
jgi:carotenoid cleavage dioxygenase-like enzyme